MARSERSSVVFSAQQLADVETERVGAEQAKKQATLHIRLGRQRILGAALATALAGIGLIWLLIVIPGQRQANASYNALNALYEGSLKDRKELEDSFRRERQLLKRQLDALLNRGSAQPSNSEPTLKQVGAHPKPLPQITVEPKPKPPCVCLDGDPMCYCKP